MNVSKNYYENQTRKIKQLTKRQDKELKDLLESILGSIESDIDPLEWQAQAMMKKGEYETKSKVIIDKYTRMIIKENERLIKFSGNKFGYSWDGYFKEFTNEWLC